MKQASIYLKPGKAKPFWYGNPLVFSGAIMKVDGDPVAGEWVALMDDRGQQIGQGVYNPHSSYRVRLLSRVTESVGQFGFAELIHHRLQQASRLRAQLGLPNAQTNAYRLFNSEGDGLSGVTIDVYGDYLVIAASAYWVEAHRDIILEALQETFPKHKYHWRSVASALRQDGWVSQSESTKETVHAPLEIQELGLRYTVSLDVGQKTGFYFDQRENREWVGRLAQGRRVLDLFCYSGGFALHAARGGAEMVIGVDSSEAAIVWAKNNAVLNGVEAQTEFVEADVLNYLTQQKPSADFIILDPPKIAPRQGALQQAMRYSERLHSAALSCMPRGGILMTASCSSAMTADLLLETAQKAAQVTKKSLKILMKTRTGMDHPVLPSLPSSDYLQALWLQVE